MPPTMKIAHKSFQQGYQTYSQQARTTQLQCGPQRNVEYTEISNIFSLVLDGIEKLDPSILPLSSVPDRKHLMSSKVLIN